VLGAGAEPAKLRVLNATVERRLARAKEERTTEHKKTNLKNKIK
jgi:hypothetical protein